MRGKLWIGVGAFVTTQAGMVAVPTIAQAATGEAAAMQPGEGEHEGRFEHGEGEHEGGEGRYHSSPRSRAAYHRARAAHYRHHAPYRGVGEHGEHEGGEHEHGD